MERWLINRTGAFLFCVAAFGAPAQPYDLFNPKNEAFPGIRTNRNTDLVFARSRLINQDNEIAHPQLVVGGYVSSYYSTNDDDNLPNGFVLFPTLEPRKDQFSLNMALISLSYRSSDYRGNITLHYGDVPESSWPATFNLIQEANGGFRLFRKWWVDMGFFKTHIGIESFQPRENIASSMSIVNYYDPYFLSGAKVTYMASQKLTFQAGVFNGYNEYLDNNRNKALSFTTIYNANQHFSLTYNVLTCDESPDSSHVKHQRIYHNLYSTLLYGKFTLGMDFNFGMQQHSLRSDLHKEGFMWGGMVIARYLFVPKLAAYGRVERFSDPNQILTGDLDIGAYIDGVTAGLEFMPLKTVGLSAEWRLLESDHAIFQHGNDWRSQRNEVNLCLDLWF